MEFVKVTFASVRGVQMDGAPEGQTGDLLGVQRGHHVFDLGEPADYTPPSRTELVAGTSQDRPMIIAFEPAAAIPPAGAMARPAKKKAKKVKKKANKKAPRKGKHPKKHVRKRNRHS